MCGIAGIVDLRDRAPVSAQVLRRMAGAVGHRGPDDQGVFVRDQVGLAHRRLAIIDPSPAGHQPMASEDGAVVVSFNGTIYNFQELRAVLQARGHRFVSRCDTEVLVHGWEEWGESLVDRLNGHFAFALWDEARRRVYLVRDRFGAKPLYYYERGGLWVFGSEIKAIMAHPDFRLELNYDAVCEYFTFQNLFRFHTLFKDVHLVPPANVAYIDLDKASYKRRSYWDYDYCFTDPGMDPREAVEEVERLLVQATRRQLVADVPVGAYLSGGMDSGSIVSVASQEIERLHTFTCGFHMEGVDGVEASFDERISAEVMANAFGTEHYQQVLGHGDVAWVLPSLIWHLEDLRLGMCYANYYIARLASKFVKVCLSGAGGDELFGGYPWRYYRAAGSLNKQEFFDAYYDQWQRLVPDELRADFFMPEALARMTDTDMKQVVTRVFTFHPGLMFDSPAKHVQNSLYFEAKTFLHGLMVLGDKLSMAHGLEERFPFLDNDLVAFAQKVPVSLKLRDLAHWQRHDENDPVKHLSFFRHCDDGKLVLRQAMSHRLPQGVTERRKQGFSSPDESWYRGPNLGWVESVILGKRAMLQEIIRPEVIRQTLREHCDKRINHRLRIWSMLCMEMWLRLFVDGDRRLIEAARAG